MFTRDNRQIRHQIKANSAKITIGENEIVPQTEHCKALLVQVEILFNDNNDLITSTKLVPYKCRMKWYTYLWFKKDTFRCNTQEESIHLNQKICHQ